MRKNCGDIKILCFFTFHVETHLKKNNVYFHGLYLFSFTNLKEFSLLVKYKNTLDVLFHFVILSADLFIDLNRIQELIHPKSLYIKKSSFSP